MDPGFGPKLFGGDPMKFRECEVVYRVRDVPGAPTRTIDSSESVYQIMGPILRERACESLYAMLLGTRRKVHSLHEVSRGGVNHCAVVPVDIFRAAVIAHATAIILVHNHPSGVPEPSAEDIELTKNVIRAGQTLGIDVLDHVVIGHSSFFSMLDAGLMPK